MLVAVVLADIIVWSLVYRRRRPVHVVTVWDRIDRNLALIEANLAVVVLNVLAWGAVVATR